MTQEFRVKRIDILDEPFETKIPDREFTALPGPAVEPAQVRTTALTAPPRARPNPQAEPGFLSRHLALIRHFLLPGSR